jgi:hypothetical protein
MLLYIFFGALCLYGCYALLVQVSRAVFVKALILLNENNLGELQWRLEGIKEEAPQAPPRPFAQQKPPEEAHQEQVKVYERIIGAQEGLYAPSCGFLKSCLG